MGHVAYVGEKKILQVGSNMTGTEILKKPYLPNTYLHMAVRLVYKKSVSVIFEPPCI
jgi:hypothetical protein